MSNTGNTQQIIDYGATANDGQGDPLRTAFIKTDENFSNIWNAGPVGSNIAIVNNTVYTNNTNGNLVLHPNGIGIVQSNAHMIPNMTNTRNLGSADLRWRTLYLGIGGIDSTGGITAGNINVTGDLTVGGNLVVEGDTIEMGNITTDSLTIQLANSAANGTQADGAGVTVGANDDLATILYDSGNNAWTTNIGMSVGGSIAGTSLSVSEATVYGNTNGIDAYFTGTVNTPNIVVNNISSDDSTVVTVQDGILVEGEAEIQGNVTAPYFIGNGSLLTGITSYANANAAAYGEAGWDGNIIPATNSYYSLGNATNYWSNLWVANNTIYIGGVPLGITASNVLTVGGEPILSNDSNTSITTTGNISADYLFGNGSQLSGMYGNTNVAAYLPTYTGNVGAGNVNFNNGSRLQAATNNITLQANVNGAVELKSHGGNYTWAFDNYGWAILPEADAAYTPVANGSVLFAPTALAFKAGLANLTFEATGNLTLPSEGNIVGVTPNNSGSLQWVGNSSGDGAGYTTLRLIPDDTATAGDQYLIIDPTAGGHIHIRAGGTQDNSLGYLYLGGENSYFQVPAGSDPNVYIAASNNVWDFGNDGVLYAPGNIQTLGNISATGNVTGAYLFGNGSQLTGLPEQYGNSNVAAFLSSFGSNTISTTGNVTANFVAPGANGQIMYNDSGLIGGSAVFTFDENGNTLTIGTTGGTLKVADIQTPQAGVSLRLIPASGITYSYGNLLPLFANTYDTGGASNRWQTVFANVANLVTASISGAASASSITLSSTGTAVNASSGNVLTNQVTGTQFNFLNGLYTVNLNAGQATANYALRLPANAGTNGQTLTTDGTGNLSWTTAAGSYGNSNVATFLAAYGSNTISTTGNITAGNLIGNISITGNVTGTSANVTLIAGSYSTTFDNTGNVTLANSNVFVGVTNTVLPNTVASFSSNVNSYTQVTNQNRNSGADATADYILTADNGSDTVNYGDFGIINSGYDVNTPTNSLGNIVRAGDTYIYAQGNVSNTSQSGGNLVLGTTVANKYVKIFAGGNTASALVANISNTGISVSGNVTATNFIGNVSLTGNIQGTSSNVELVAGSYTFTFDNVGVATFPAVGGDEGGEINFGIPTSNTTLLNTVKVDVYQDRIRFFDGSTKGAYIDMSQTGTGVSTLLNNRVSGYVNAGTYVTMDNLKATVSTAGNRSLQIATVSGSYAVFVNAIYTLFGGGTGGTGATFTLTTTPTLAIGWNFTAQGDLATYIINDTTNSRTYRVTMMIGGSYNNNMISIERLI